ncbi:MAG: exodeoxyribonuclease V subunit beta, partial [Rhodanobacter sp.]
GWCQRMLGQHAFDSGQAPAQNGMSDEDELLAEAVRDYWRRYFFPLDRDDAGLITALWKTPRALQKAVKPLLRQPLDNLRLSGQTLPAIDDITAMLRQHASPLRQAEADARRYWSDAVDAIEAMLSEAMQAGAFKANMMKPEKFGDDLQALRLWAAGGVIDDAVLARYTQEKLRSATKNKFTTPEHASFDAIGRLLDTQSSAPSLQPLILAHAIPWIAQRRDNARLQRAQLGYDDMLIRLDAALHGANGEQLARTIATQYPVALIDEFQDTDPLQWRIFQRIYGERSDTGLLLIGDPKQAIYGFRGADIHTYLQARTTAEQPTWTLAKNYRSTEALVGAVNRVFEHANDQPLGAFGFGRGEQGLPFLAVEAQGRSDRLLLNDQPLPALQLARQAGDAAISGGAYTHSMAEHAAAQLVQWLDAAQAGHCAFVVKDDKRTPLKPSDIAILVRNQREAGAIRTALQQRGLASVYLSDRDSVYAAPEAQDILLWLHACAAPESDRSMRAALASATLDWSHNELDRLNHDEQFWEQCGEQFRRLHESWQRHGVLAMLHDLLHQFDLPARLLARTNGERALTNVLHLAELLQQAATGLDGDHALIRHLAAQIARAIDGTADTAEEQIVRLESEADLIKVVTIHKSKGLEYPLVLLPFVCSFRVLRSNDSFVWHDDAGRPLLDLQPDTVAWQQAERERLQEDLRLLYVALTRARHACWLGVACLKQGNAKASALHKSAFGYVLAGGEPIEPSSLLSQLEALRGDHADIQILELADVAETAHYRPTEAPTYLRPARISTLRPTEPWWIASYSALAHTTTSVVPHVAPETAVQDVLAETTAEQAGAESIDLLPHHLLPQRSPHTDGIHAFDRGAGPGTFLHGLLEWAADEGFAHVATAPDSLEEFIARRCQPRGWRAWIKPLTQWLPALLRTPLPLAGNIRAPLSALTDSATYRSELEFWFEAHRVDTRVLDRLVSTHTLGGVARPSLATSRVNGMLKGFIDLVFEYDGRYYIVDYKSNWLGDEVGAYSHAAMRHSVLHSRYDLQYAIYTLALHRQLRARLPDYDYHRHIGGVLYLYLRGVDEAGHGVHYEHLPYALVEAMDRLFADGGHADVA